MYKLFIDDLREPVDDSWVVVRSYDAAVQFMQDYGCPYKISFDHDLGEDDDGNELKSGKDVANWLVDHDLDCDGRFLPDDFSFFVHSDNPVGKENIEGLLNGYLRQR